MTINTFTNIGNTINTTVGAFLSSIQNGYASDLISLAKVCVVLYIIVYGYAILAGKRNTPFKDIVWDLTKLAMILGVLQGAFGLMNGLTGFVDELKGFFVGGENAYSLLDEKFNILANLVTKIWTKASGVEETLLAIVKIFGLLPLLLGFISCGAMIVYTEIVSKILLATAPIFIFCLMWGWLKDSFAQWLSAILGNCLVLLFTSATMQLSFELASVASTSGELDIWHSVIMYVIAGMLSIMAIKWGREIAISLAKVSVDRGFGKGLDSIANAKAGAKGAVGVSRATYAGYQKLKSKFSKD